MSTRERRERRAEQLREWADGREAKADAAYEGVQAITDRIPFGQPILVGHHSERGARADQRRIANGMDRFCEHNAKAADMRGRAENIERQAATAIYSDDDDAIEQLRAKIDRLEAQRAEIKRLNAAARKGTLTDAEAQTLAAANRYAPIPGKGGGFPSYHLTNLSGNISRLRKRLAQLERERENPRASDRIISARYAGECADCGAAIERGQAIRYSRAAGARCETC
jgi:DNA repair exonuclease SbcCD ATPase subunit